MIRLKVLVLTLVLGLAACSSADGGTANPTKVESTGLSATTEVSATTDSASSIQVTEELSAASKSGFPGIELLTPASGGGTRPILEWVAVEGASHYLVAVRTPEGKGYWAWRTEDTSVPVGGWPRLNEEANGPRVAKGMTWSVIAVDKDGTIIAVSNHRPISP